MPRQARTGAGAVLERGAASPLVNLLSFPKKALDPAQGLVKIFARGPRRLLVQQIASGCSDT